MFRQKPLLSIVTPTFNRQDLVQRSVKSALDWIGERDDMEIVVVDDASTDGTVEALTARFAEAIIAGTLRIRTSPINRGVTGAKNFGASLSAGEWLLFLDSDDLLAPWTREELVIALQADITTPVHFFRCRDLTTDTLIGAPLAGAERVDAVRYLRRWDWSECLPVVRADAFRRFPYDETLRGHEGVTYARMIRAIGPATVQPLEARLYDASGADRLSNRSGLRRRARLLAKGYVAMLAEFPRELGMRGLASTGLRVVYYSLLSLLGPIFRSWR